VQFRQVVVVASAGALDIAITMDMDEEEALGMAMDEEEALGMAMYMDEEEEEALDMAMSMDEDEDIYIFEEEDMPCVM